jgi:hypothetical protein
MNYAIIYGNKSVVEFFIDMGFTDFDSALQQATRFGYPELVKLFVPRVRNGQKAALAACSQVKAGEILKILKPVVSDWSAVINTLYNHQRFDVVGELEN